MRRYKLITLAAVALVGFGFATADAGTWNGYNRYHHHHHSNVFFGVGLGLGSVGFGYPYGIGYPYGYGYGYPYGYGYGYGPGYGYSAPVQGEVVGGSYGSVVARVQQRLARAGYYNGSIDGVAGSGTHRAIRAFERDHGLPVDGQIDRQLLATMGLA